jgi:hypothetical protein
LSELKLVHGKPRHPQSQGSVEWANADIKSMIISWTHENNNTHWSEGLTFAEPLPFSVLFIYFYFFCGQVRKKIKINKKDHKGLRFRSY